MNESFASPELERHSRKCCICRHPDRDAIEEEFIHWHRVIWIAQQYDIYDHRSIYRHARALGLIKERRENLHSALDNIVEQSDGISASAGDVLKAIRAYSCLSDTGRWTELPPPPRHLTYSSDVNHVHPEGTNGDRRAVADMGSDAPIGGPMPGRTAVTVTDQKPASGVSTTLEAAAELSEEIADLAEADEAPAEANETEVGVELEGEPDPPGPPPLAQRVPFVIYSTDHDILDRAAGIDHRPYGRR